MLTHRDDTIVRELGKTAPTIFPITKKRMRIPVESIVIIHAETRGILTLLEPYTKLATNASMDNAITSTTISIQDENMMNPHFF